MDRKNSTVSLAMPSSFSVAETVQFLLDGVTDGESVAGPIKRAATKCARNADWVVNHGDLFPAEDLDWAIREVRQAFEEWKAPLDEEIRGLERGIADGLSANGGRRTPATRSMAGKLARRKRRYETVDRQWKRLEARVKIAFREALVLRGVERVGELARQPVANASSVALTVSAF